MCTAITPCATTQLPLNSHKCLDASPRVLWRDLLCLSRCLPVLVAAAKYCCEAAIDDALLAVVNRLHSNSSSGAEKSVRL